MLSWNWQGRVLGELLYTGDLVLMSEVMIKGLWNKFTKWKEAFDGKDLKVNL